MKKLSILLLIFMSMSLAQCEKEDEFTRFITFRNNSARDILLRISTNYPDTMLPKDCIEVYEVFRAGQSTDAVFLQSYIKKILMNDVLILFVYDYKTFAYTPFDSVRINHLELSRYELTREWLDEHDWTVVYP